MQNIGGRKVTNNMFQPLRQTAFTRTNYNVPLPQMSFDDVTWPTVLHPMNQAALTCLPMGCQWQV